MLNNFEKIKEFYQFNHDLTEQDLEVLIQVLKPRAFKKKELLIDAGSSSKRAFFITKGLVRCYCINEKGGEITYALFPGNHVLMNSDVVLFNRPSKFYYEAIEYTEVLYSELDIVEEVIASHPKLEANRKYLMERALKEARDRIDSFVLHSPEERYLMYVKKYPHLVNRVPNKYIAHILGITPVSLSRLRRRLVQRNRS